MGGVENLAAMRKPDLLRRSAAEALGAFALVFAGCGAIVTDAHTHGALGVVGVSMVFGLVILAGIAALGHVSGAHFNPAVTLSFFLTRHLPGKDALAYLGGQLAGATVAALLLWAILSVATDTRALGAPAAIAIGATIGLDALFGGPLTGASMNPARSFAPAMVSGQWRDFWVYLAGPLIGAPLGAFAYQFVRGEHAGLLSPVPVTEKV
jgi:aquaporin NIP